MTKRPHPLGLKRRKIMGVILKEILEQGLKSFDADGINFSKLLVNPSSNELREAAKHHAVICNS